MIIQPDLFARATPLDAFKERIAKRPYHSDDLNYGLRIASAEQALKARYIQPNGPTHKYWLVFDIDRPGAAIDWQDCEGPTPNITVMNPKNRHAHLLYGLDISVRTTPDALQGPLRLAAAVEHALMLKLRSDRSYGGLIAKNPMHTHWKVIEWRHELYDLHELSEYVDLFGTAGPASNDAYGLGRNVTLFDTLRAWAYKAIRQGWPDFDQWLQAVHTRATAININFDTPLPANEVEHTAKSIAKWTHKHFSATAFKKMQSERGRRSGAARRKSTPLEHNPEPWIKEGISRATWYRRQKK